jgi:hypothetical protein
MSYKVMVEMDDISLEDLTSEKPIHRHILYASHMHGPGGQGQGASGYVEGGRYVEGSKGSSVGVDQGREREHRGHRDETETHETHKTHETYETVTIPPMDEESPKQVLNPTSICYML